VNVIDATASQFSFSRLDLCVRAKSAPDLSPWARRKDARLRYDADILINSQGFSIDG
jgi:hypothetical protein